MRYYLIAGEASGDLHASRLMRSLKREDSRAEFRFFGGDLMAAEGGQRVRHYRELAYMGFVPVLLHLRTIFANMAMCKRDIAEWHPDVVILVDYPGFNLDIAKFVHAKTHILVYYYISPKIWAWKEWRIGRIKRDVDELFSILPFEVPFFEGKHHYPIHYVGNPTVEEVDGFQASYEETREAFCKRHQLDPQRPVIALLAGSRKQEIKDNLPSMIAAAAVFTEGRAGEAGQRLATSGPCQLVVAGAPGIDDEYYAPFVVGKPVRMVKNETYALLAHSVAALVTSGTATLETALFGVPQVVCYKTPLPHLMRFAFKHVIRCKYISLVNLIADKTVVQELFADRFRVDCIREELGKLLPGGAEREQMLAEYRLVRDALGCDVAPDNAALQMVRMLRKGHASKV